MKTFKMHVEIPGTAASRQTGERRASVHAPGGEFIARRVRLEGTEINVLEGPNSGPPLVLIPGMLDVWQSYLAVLMPLAQHFRVLCMDLRGHGESGRARRYRVVDYAGDVISLIEELVGRPVYIAGQSLGGLVAVCTAARRPDLVKAIACEDAPFFLTEQPHWLSHPFHGTFAAIAQVLEQHLRAQGDTATLAESIARAVPMPRPKVTLAPLDRQIAAGKTLCLRRAVGVWPTDEVESARIVRGWGGYIDGRSPMLGDVLPQTALTGMAAILATTDSEAPATCARGELNLGFDHALALQSLNVPVMILEADRDIVGMYEDATRARIVECLARTEHRWVYVPGSDHAIHECAPETYSRELVSFFRRT